MASFSWMIVVSLMCFQHIQLQEVVANDGSKVRTTFHFGSINLIIVDQTKFCLKAFSVVDMFFKKKIKK